MGGAVGAGGVGSLVETGSGVARGYRVGHEGGHGGDGGGGAGERRLGPLRALRHVWRLVKPDRGDLIAVTWFSLAIGVLALATPVAVQTLVNFVAFGSLVVPLVVLATAFFLVLTVSAVIQWTQVYVVELLQRRLFARVAATLGDRLPRVSAEAFDAGHSQSTVNYFFDVLTVQKQGATLLLDGVALTLQAVVGLAILGFYHPLLLAFSGLLIGSIAFVLFVMGYGAVRTAVAESDAKYRVAARLEEIVRNPFTFKQADAHGLGFAIADGAAQRYIARRKEHFRIVQRQVVGALALQAIAATALLSMGGYLVIQQQLTLGQLVAAELIVGTVLAAFAKFGVKLSSLYDLCAASYKLELLMDQPRERESGHTPPPANGPALVDMAHVRFSYLPGRPVLEDFSLRLEPGERVALVGSLGYGKSTVGELLFGLRPADSGRIEIDGVPLAELSLGAIRRDVVVLGKTEVVEASVEWNVTLGRPGLGWEEARRALSDVGLLDEVNDLPNGVHTVLRHDGTPLSSTQVCRLVVARAIAASPRLLVVDGLIDDLDASAREEVLRGLMPPGRPWTLLLLCRHEWAAGAVDRVVRLSAPPRTDFSRVVPVPVRRASLNGDGASMESGGLEGRGPGLGSGSGSGESEGSHGSH